MNESSLAQRATAEALGTCALVAAVVGSGIMGEQLAGGNAALALLANSIATGAALVALISTLAPISGAHLNPLVTLASSALGQRSWIEACVYVAAQIGGALAGTMLAHAMFAMPLLAYSEHARHGFAPCLSEFVATFGLLAVVCGCSRRNPSAVPLAVAAYITAAYWFTASTSFANPAVTVARAFTNTFSGVRLQDVPAFVASQLLGAALATALAGWLFREPALQKSSP